MGFPWILPVFFAGFRWISRVFLEALPRGLRLSAARDLQEERLKVSAYLTLAEGGNKLLGTGLLGLQELQAYRGGPRYGSRVGAFLGI